MEKDRVVCLLYCGGADSVAIYVNGKKVDSIESTVEFPNALQNILNHTSKGAVVYSIDDDDITSEAFDNYYESDNADLTEAEEKAMIAGDGKEVDRLWKERGI